MLNVAFLDFILRQFAITIEVHSPERLINLQLFLFGQKLRCNKGVRGLLELGIGIELNEVIQHVHCLFLVIL